MKSTIIQAIDSALQSLSLTIDSSKITLDRPAEMQHGDYSTNIALASAKELKSNPVALAIQIVDALNKQGIEGVEKIQVAGPGFINFQLKPEAIQNALSEIISLGSSYGKNSLVAGKKIAYEYTDPNPFKVFHIGHLMANTIGESLSRLAEFSGGEVKRFNYQGDVGRHVALSIWGIRFLEEKFPEDTTPLKDRVDFFGRAYAAGAQKFYEIEKQAEDKEDDSSEMKAFKEIEQVVQSINRKVYDRSDEEINTIYDKGREWSLELFEELYTILGTTFDQYFFESQATPVGLQIVKENTAPSGKAVFEESDGAIIFPGEKYGLHTRVYVNKFGLPTYDGKEIGLAQLKYEAYPYDLGVTVTANEQDDYFKVALKAIELLFPELAGKATHVSHGMLRLTTGKMSSRKGDVITGESLIHDMIDMSLEKMQEREMSDDEKKKVAEQVGVAAIKYTVLRQATGKDIIFDPEKSLSFEGDSGPYLQYATVRANSILEKAKKEGIEPAMTMPADQKLLGTLDWSGGTLERLLVRFPEIVERAYTEEAPHTVANYLMELAGTFNSFYANTQIVKKEDTGSSYKVALVKAFVQVMTNGLWLLGIKVPAKM